MTGESVHLQGKIGLIAGQNRDVFARMAHLLGVSTTDLVWMLERGAEMARKRENTIEATRSRAQGQRRRNAGAQRVSSAMVRGLEGHALPRSILPAGPERAVRESYHKTRAHYRLRDGEGRYLRLDCEGLTDDAAWSWIGTEEQMARVRNRFPLARPLAVVKVPVQKDAPVPRSI